MYAHPQPTYNRRDEVNTIYEDAIHNIDGRTFQEVADWMLSFSKDRDVPMSDLSFDVNAYDDYGDARVSINVERPYTAHELKKIAANQKRNRVNALARERAEFERLKAKFEAPNEQS